MTRHLMDMDNRIPKIGDRIKFRVVVRDGTKTAVRKVTGFWFGQPAVRFQGYDDFVIRHREVLEIVSHGE